MPQQRQVAQLQVFWTTLIHAELTVVQMEILVIFQVPSLPKQLHKLLPGRNKIRKSRKTAGNNWIFSVYSNYSDSFANFGAVFDSTITAAPQAATPSQDAFLLDDLLAPAPAEPSSSPFHAFSTNVMPQGNHLMIGYLYQ